MRDAIDQFHADQGVYPTVLEELASNDYLRSIPDDPFTNSAETWVTVLAEVDPSDPLTQGIYDVRSGSLRTALDGTQYAEW